MSTTTRRRMTFARAATIARETFAQYWRGAFASAMLGLAVGAIRDPDAPGWAGVILLILGLDLFISQRLRDARAKSETPA